MVIPTTATDEVDRFPPYGPFAVPYMTIALLGAACVQVALGVTGHLPLFEIPEPDDGMDVISALGGALACVGVGRRSSCFVIMRRLLRKATDLQAEMAEVV